MRKCYCRSFANSLLGLAVFCVGLIVIDNPEVTYGNSCPDVLLFLATDTEDSSATFSERTEGNEFSIVSKDLIDNETSLDDNTNDEEDFASYLEFGSDSLELTFENEEVPLSDSFENNEDCLTVEEFSNNLNEEIVYNIDESSENSNETDYNVATGNEIDVLISQVESVSDDLAAVLNETSEEIITENVESDENDPNVSEYVEYALQRTLDTISSVEEAEKYTNALLVEDSLTDSGSEDNLTDEGSSEDCLTDSELYEGEESELQVVEKNLTDEGLSEDYVLESGSDDNEESELPLTEENVNDEGLIEDSFIDSEFDENEESELPLTDENVNDKEFVEDSLLDSESDENEESILPADEENVPDEDEQIVNGEFDGTVLLPNEIEATLEEVNVSKDEDYNTDSDKESAQEQNLSEVGVVSSGESRFNNAEQLLSENLSTDESLSPNALEIEEINREYGWETVGSDSDSTRCESVMGFGTDVHTKRVDDRRFNKRYGEKVDSSLSNEFWIVGQNGSGYYYWKYENNAWNRLSQDEFFSTDDPGRTTIIWAHGYQTDMSSATQSATVLKSLIEKGLQNTNQNRPYRLVVWKWNSERNMARIRIDAKNKTALANCSGVSLGKFIGRFNPSDKVCLIGFSFGAQVVGEALQYLATHPDEYLQNVKGRNEGVATSGTSNSVSFGKVSLMLISAACDSNAFNRGGVYASGAVIPTRVLNVFNPYDYALRYYPFVSNVRADALGVNAVTNDVFPNAEGRISNFDVSGSVGREHSFTDEIRSVPTESLVDVLFCD